MAYEPEWMKGEKFDPHPQTPVSQYKFYSAENVRKIQQMCVDAGLGLPRPWSLKPYMDQVFSYNAGIYNVDCIPDYNQYIDEHVEALNNMLLLNIRPRMQATKAGFQQYYRDINTRRIPDNPVSVPVGYKTKSQTIINPYYYSMT
jgi:hypothetical protein